MARGTATPKIFAVVTKDGTRLVKATRVAEVEELLLAGIDIRPIDAVDLALHMSNGIRVEDATQQ